MRTYLRKKEVVYIVLLIAAWVLWQTGIFFFDKYNKKEFDRFYSTDIHGNITYLQASSGGERFKVQGSDHINTFHSRATYFNNYDFFYSTAEKGDSVYKPAWSDTLYLRKKDDGRTYKFTFH